ncbi:MAG: FISUMP domain-containing protein, partial [Bacteroidota bacterium]
MKYKKKLILLILIATTSTFIYGQFTCGDTMIDIRDGQKYPTVLIGNICWMKNNLNFYTNSGSWYMANDSASYHNFGKLYNWETAQNVCPDSWVLPSDNDWINLEMEYGMDSIEAYTMGHRGG